MTMTIAKAATRVLPGGPYELGEGPSYDRLSDTAWWFDIVGCRLMEHRFGFGDTIEHALPRMGSVIASVDDRRQVLAMEDGLHLRDRRSGALSPLLAIEADRPDTRSNDGRTHPSGALWIGTMGRRADPGLGTIYWTDGASVHALFRDITIPNSICFSPDGRIGYFADSARNTVFRVALSPDDGRPIGAPEVFLTAENLPLGGVFDGSVVDADGALWNAAWGGGAISGFAPTGEMIRSYETPASQASCPCFVGPQLDQMLVTSAWEGLDATGRAADPSAGLTFLIDGGFRGRADAEFKLPEPAGS